jgi:hypothetical protein
MYINLLFVGLKELKNMAVVFVCFLGFWFLVIGILNILLLYGREPYRRIRDKPSKQRDKEFNGKGA